MAISKAKQKKIKELLMLSGKYKSGKYTYREIARAVKCVPNTVITYHKKHFPNTPSPAQNEQAGVEAWKSHPWVEANPDKLLKMNKRDLRSIRKTGVLDYMQEHNTFSPRDAERILTKKAEAERLAAAGLSPKDITIERANIVTLPRNIAPDDCVDICLTDPPYSKKYIYEYGHLALAATRVLKDGGLLICLTGQSALPELLPMLALISPELTYVWTIAVITDGRFKMQYQPKAKPQWKPLLLFVKGKKRYTGKPYFDTIKTKPLARNYEKLHEWEQPVEFFDEVLARFAKPGMVVFDPFCGSGASGVASVKAKCKYIGCDYKQKWVNMTRKRVFAELDALKSSSAEDEAVNVLHSDK